VEQSKTIRWSLANGSRTVPLAFEVIERVDGGITPGVLCVIETAAARFLPFRFGGKPVDLSPHFRKPFAISRRVKPCDANYRLIVTREMRIIPAFRLRMPRSPEELGIFMSCDRSPRDRECIEPDAMTRFFPSVVLVGAHPEPAFGNDHHIRRTRHDFSLLGKTQAR